MINPIPNPGESRQRELADHAPVPNASQHTDSDAPDLLHPRQAPAPRTVRVPEPAGEVPPGSVLGLVLGTREVGHALTTGDHLLTCGVLNIKKLVSQEGRESRFRHMVENYLERHAVTAIALVEPYPGIAEEPLIRAMLAWLHDRTREAGVRLETHSYAAVMASFGTGSSAAVHRSLAATLATRFPELQPFTPASELPARGHLVPEHLAARLPRVPTPRERYWNRAFLAVAAGLHAIQLANLPKSSTHP